MATPRRSSADTPTIGDLMDGDASINEWAIIESDALSVTWSNPTTGERIKLRPGMKPSENIVSIARMNGAMLSPDMEPISLFDDEPVLVDDEATPVDRLLTLLRDETAGERAEVKIYRMRDGQKDSYCGSFKPEEFEAQNLELIRQHFGAGKFRVKVYATHPGSGKFVIRMNETVEIEASALQNQNVPQNSGLDLLMQRLDRMENNTQQQQQGGGMGSMREMLQMFVMMKQAFGGNEPAQKSTISETVEAIRTLRDLSGEIGGGSSAASPDLLSMGGEVLKIIAANQAAQPAQMPMVQQAPFPQIQTEAAPTPVYQNPTPAVYSEPNQNENESENEMNPFVKIMFSVLLKKAAAGAPVEPIAADLYPRLPESVLDAVESEMWFDLLQEFHPAVKEHESWFSALRSALLVEIAKDEAQD